MKQKLTVIKVGGAVVEEPSQLDALLERFAAVQGHKVLVHGGGRSATRIAARLGVESRMVDGRRLTDDSMLSIVTMVYGGLLSKRIVARLQAKGVNALGVCGADMDLIRAHKRPVGDVDYGWVGDVDRADGEALRLLLQQGVVPVVAPLTHDGCGHLLNTNADTIASHVACALAPHFEVTLVYAFEQPGVLSRAGDPTSVIPRISEADLRSLEAQGIVSGGMLPKLSNAFSAIRAGVSRVVITSAADLSGQHGTVVA